MTRPPIEAFTAAERRIIRRCTTPDAVQRWLNAMPYNAEPDGPTQRSFRGVVQTGRAHCLEAALSAATILEQHGYPPLVLSFESIDQLDHVIFVYRHEGKWGSVARSRDPGLHGRLPVFRRARDLASSYVDGYVDFTGRITAYAVVHLGGISVEGACLSTVGTISPLGPFFRFRLLKTSKFKKASLLSLYL